MTTPPLEIDLANAVAPPTERQDATAPLAMEVVTEEETWNEQFARSQDLFESLGAAVLAEEAALAGAAEDERR